MMLSASEWSSGENHREEGTCRRFGNDGWRVAAEAGVMFLFEQRAAGDTSRYPIWAPDCFQVFYLRCRCRRFEGDVSWCASRGCWQESLACPSQKGAATQMLTDILGKELLDEFGIGSELSGLDARPQTSHNHCVKMCYNVFFGYWDTQILSWLFPNVRGRCLVCFDRYVHKLLDKFVKERWGQHTHGHWMSLMENHVFPGPPFYLLITVTLLFDPRFGARSTEGPVPAGFFLPSGSKMGIEPSMFGGQSIWPISVSLGDGCAFICFCNIL